MRKSSLLYPCLALLAGCLQVGEEDSASITSQLSGSYGGAAAQSGTYDGKLGDPRGVAARYYDQNLQPGGGVAARYYDQNLQPGGGVAGRYYDQNLQAGSGGRGE